jgi:hypothetical protein
VCREWRAIISDLAFLVVHKSPAEPVSILVTPTTSKEKEGSAAPELGDIKNVLGNYAHYLTLDDAICITGSIRGPTLLNWPRGQFWLTARTKSMKFTPLALGLSMMAYRVVQRLHHSPIYIVVKTPCKNHIKQYTILVRHAR